jgi:peptidoglycan/xylan/chitin deacetylase (PgdA/CDA1 family)
MSDPGYGALILSLDFEIHWGVFDIYDTESSYTANLDGVWTVVPKILDMFREFDIAATWATVGALFATSRDHFERSKPCIRPPYHDPLLDPYDVPIGENETDDHYHYAPSLIHRVIGTPRQEIGTHTFGHIYYNAPGQTLEAVRADLQSAKAIAREYGLDPTSIVFPRNQVSAEYLPMLTEMGITSYRGLEPHWMYHGDDYGRPYKRIARLMDRYVRLSDYGLARWPDLVGPGGLVNLPSTRFLQPKTAWPGFEQKRLRWITNGIASAARTHRLIHLWWHPHDFGAQQEENLAMLRVILETAARYRDSHGLRSITMAEAARAARAL